MAVVLDGTTGISASGNIIAGGNITVSGTLIAGTYSGNLSPENMTATGNVQALNLTATANLDGANLNVTSDAYITGNLTVTGNAQLSGNIVGDRITNGTTSIEIQTINGNANITVGGVANVVVFTDTGAVVTGVLSATGNVTGGNIITAGIVSATGNITSGNVNTVGLNLSGNVIGNVSTTANIQAGNLIANDGIYGNVFTTLIDSADSSTVTVTPELVCASDLTVQNDFYVNRIDSQDSSEIVVTPAVRLESNLEVENELTVRQEIFTETITTTGTARAGIFVGDGSGLSNVATLVQAVGLSIALGS